MIVRPEIEALRSDDAPQRAAQDTLIRLTGAWRAQPRVGALLAEIEAFGLGKPFAQCPSLAALFEEGGRAARELVDSFVQMAIAGLATAPLGHVPVRHFTDGVHSTLLLARSGQVTLSLVAVDGDGLSRRPAPVTVDFGPSEVRERVLAGLARAEAIELTAASATQARLERRDLALRPGMIVSRDARRQALVLREVRGCLVSLRLQRRLVDSGPTREYRIDDGCFVHQAAGNPADSRCELAMALLGRMQRVDAAPLLAEIACGNGSAALRWQALRECLALDTCTGFGALTALATSTGDELATPAGALRAQLVEAHPRLAENA